MRHIETNAEWASRQSFDGEVLKVNSFKARESGPSDYDCWVGFVVGGKKLSYNKTMVDREIEYQKAKL